MNNTLVPQMGFTPSNYEEMVNVTIPTVPTAIKDYVEQNWSTVANAYLTEWGGVASANSEKALIASLSELLRLVIEQSQYMLDEWCRLGEAWNEVEQKNSEVGQEQGGYQFTPMNLERRQFDTEINLNFIEPDQTKIGLILETSKDTLLRVLEEYSTGISTVIKSNINVDKLDASKALSPVAAEAIKGFIEQVEQSLTDLQTKINEARAEVTNAQLVKYEELTEQSANVLAEEGAEQASQINGIMN